MDTKTHEVKCRTHPAEIRELLRENSARRMAESLNWKLNSVKRQLERSLNDIQEEKRIEYTGWHVLLIRDGDAWKCVGLINENDDKSLENFIRRIDDFKVNMRGMARQVAASEINISGIVLRV